MKTNMEKILKIQTEIGVLVKSETNPFFKSKYMDINGLLEQLLPLLEKHGLTVIQPLSNIGFEKGAESTKSAIRTKIYDGDKLIVDEAIPLPDIQDPQKMGSAITYYRRYALQSLFLLRAEDDDGNSAVVKKNPANTIVAPIKATGTPFVSARKAISEADNLDYLIKVKEQINKSKLLTDTEKNELSEILKNKLEGFDPTE